jgi:hypothetical protein
MGPGGRKGQALLLFFLTLLANSRLLLGAAYSRLKPARYSAVCVCGYLIFLRLQDAKLKESLGAVRGERAAAVRWPRQRRPFSREPEVFSPTLPISDPVIIPFWARPICGRGERRRWW